MRAALLDGLSLMAPRASRSLLKQLAAVLLQEEEHISA